MTYYGDFPTGVIVRFGWNSNAVAGESITRATNGTISVYKDGNTTQSTTGVTDTEDFDSLTGVHLVAIDTSQDGTFYSAGSDFMVVLSAATIDGKSINAVLGQFSLNNRSGLRPTVAGRTLDVSAGGEAGVDWANVGSPTTTLNLSGTTVKTATDVEADTQDIQNRLPAALVSGRIDASVGAMAADVVTAAAVAANAIGASELATDAVNEIRDAILSDSTPFPGARIDAAITTRLAPTVAGRTLDVNTGGEAGVDLDNTSGTLAKGTDLTGFNDLDAAGVRSAVGLASANLDTQLDAIPTAAEINAEVDTALADVNLDHLVGTASGIPAVPAGTFLDQLMDDGTAAYDRTTDSLQAIRDYAASAAALQIVDDFVDDLEGRLTAARAGYLDNLNVGGNVASAAALQIVDDFVDDLEGRLPATFSELGSVPGATPTLAQCLMLLYMQARNKLTQTATQAKFHNDADSAIGTATTSDDGTTFTRGKFA